MGALRKKMRKDAGTNPSLLLGVKAALRSL
jgi:hypothetical protein